jgi:VIT1/CCC1 family predicted Fe2+/Mn2+ transporter
MATKKTEQEMRRRDSELLAERTAQVQRGGARAAVLGVNDGLVSTVSLILGVAAAGASAGAVLTAGFAGLVAGAVSMAAGEWISVQSQVDLFKGILGDLKVLIKRDKQLLVDQIEENFEAAGVGAKTAKKAATELASDNQQVYDVYSTRVMGLNPDELGSPWVAAVSSFGLFTLGALAPLAPWFFANETTPLYIWLSVIFTGLGSLVAGGYVGKTSGLGTTRGAIRQLLIVLFASAVTYGIGYIFGVTVG